MTLKRFQIFRFNDVENAAFPPPIFVIGHQLKTKLFTGIIEIYFGGELVAVAPKGSVVTSTLITGEEV